MNRERIARGAAIAAGASALSLAYWWPAFRVPDATGFGDWQMIHHNWEAGLVALTRYGELPLFDPYHCGGVTLVGNPEAQVYSPLFLLALALGSTLATKVFIVLHTAAALVGTFHYARAVAHLSRPASALSAVVFAGSGFFAWHLAGGHATFAPFAFLPWLHLALRRGERKPILALLGGLLLALTVAEGGTYPAPYMALSLGLAGMVRTIGDPALLPRVVRSLGLIAFSGVLASLHRLVPIARTLSRLPRTISSVDQSSLDDLLEMLTARDHPWMVPGHEFVWPEYGTYVGFAVLVLGALGLSRALLPRTRAVAVEHGLLATCAVLLILGNVSSLHPWPVLRALPVFDSLRVPSRFFVVLTFHLGILAGLGLDLVDARRLDGRRRYLVHAVACAAVLAITIDIVIVTRPIVDRWTGPAIDGSFIANDRTFITNRSYDAVYASLPRRNQTTTLCYVGGMNWPVSPILRLGQVPQATLEGPGSVRVQARTASTWTLRVAAEEATILLLNQNFDPSYRTSVGRVVERYGLLGVELPPGDHRVHVFYAQAEQGMLMVLSSVVTMLTIAAAVNAHRRARPTGVEP